MNWTEPKPPTDGESYYDHVKCETPLGLIKIEWKSWKKSDNYSTMLNEEYIGDYLNLEEAKAKAKLHLIAKTRELIKFLEL